MAVAAQHGASKSALGRHKLNCLAPKLAAAAKIVQPVKKSREAVTKAKAIVAGKQPTALDLLTLEGLLCRLGRSLDRLEGAAEAAAEDNLHASLAAVSGQLHRGIEAAGKLQGLGAEPEGQRASFSITINLPSDSSPAAKQVLADVETEKTQIPPPNEGAMHLQFPSVFSF